MNQQEFMDGIAKWQQTMTAQAKATAAFLRGGNMSVVAMREVTTDPAVPTFYSGPLGIPWVDGAKPPKSVIKRKAAQKALIATVVAPTAPAPAGTASERIRAAIAMREANTVKSLCATLSLGGSTVANALTALVRSGAIRRPSAGTYEAVGK